MMRQDWIDMKDELVATTRQCELAGVSRATMYARQKRKAVDEDDLRLSRLIDEEYTGHPFYGIAFKYQGKPQSNRQAPGLRSD